MSGEPVAPRILRYLVRQRKWLESRIDEVSALRVTTDNESSEEAIAALHRQRQEELATFQREQDALYREWEAAAESVSEEDRRAVRAEAEACAELAAKLAARQAEILRSLEARQAEGQAGIGNLRRGRQALRGYGTGDEPPQNAIDRRA